ncbi:hypothetical protein [Prosthecomicrobium sp. N25]|uniref:hypothetical protein n=1 Tax=Prosthecomicrobium sp. N25 TaxID=3129254 RepID=UPI003077AFCA
MPCAKRRSISRALLLAAALAGPVALAAAAPAGGDAPPAAPEHLRDTGLYADPERRAVDPAHLTFAPQYALWTDGAAKRRWISLPPGSRIDASDPDDWRFPVGTRVWKEFAFDGRPVETRYMERLPDGTWLYAAYAWNPEGTDALRVGPAGRRRAYPLPGGASHVIPGVQDCKACHEGQASRVLGFSALQLSPDRDPRAPHAEPPPAGSVDLAGLAATGLLEGLPPALLADPPRIRAPTAEARAALGYLHGNCGHCHDRSGPLASLGLVLRHPALAPEATPPPALATTLGVPARRLGSEGATRIHPGDPDLSLLVQRAASRAPTLQMPPLGTATVDHDAVRLLRAWIAQLDPKPTRRPDP